MRFGGGKEARRAFLQRDWKERVFGSGRRNMSVRERKKLTKTYGGFDGGWRRPVANKERWGTKGETFY